MVHLSISTCSSIRFCSVCPAACYRCISVGESGLLMSAPVSIVKWPCIPDGITCSGVSLPDVNIVTLVSFWCTSAWYAFFQALTLNLRVSSYLKCVFYGQHVVGSCFFIKSDKFCLLIAYSDNLHWMWLLSFSLYFFFHLFLLLLD